MSPSRPFCLALALFMATAMPARAQTSVGGIAGVGYFRGDAKDMVGRNRELGEQSLVGHAVIALRVSGRHMALVTPKEEDVLP